MGRQSNRESQSGGKRFIFPFFLGATIACVGPGESAVHREAVVVAEPAPVDLAAVEDLALGIEDELADVASPEERRLERGRLLALEISELAGRSDLDLATLRATAAALRARTYASAGDDERPAAPFVPTADDLRLARAIDEEVAATRAVHPEPPPEFRTPVAEGVATAPPVLGESCTASSADVTPITEVSDAH